MFNPFGKDILACSSIEVNGLHCRAVSVKYSTCVLEFDL